MWRMTISTRIALAMGVLVLLFFGTTIVAYMLTVRTQSEAAAQPVLVYLSIMTGIGGIVGAIAAIVLIRGIVHPIGDLTNGVEAFDRGQFDIRIETVSDDEIGVLAKALNNMAESRQNAETQLYEMAYRDPLTKLPNRAQFQLRLVDAIGHARRNSQMVAVLLLDLDHFKNVNDTLGHPAGDALLQYVAIRLEDCVRDTDTVARLGGDEFAIIQNHLNDKQRVETLASRIIDRLSQPFDIEGDRVHSGTSIGVSLFPDDAVDSDELLRSADLALYRAKHEGRGSFYLYDTELDHEVKSRSAMEVDLRGALERDEFYLAYQPKQELKSGRITGAEALIRWKHAERGIVPTDQFIRVAEQSGMIMQLTDFVLRSACRDMKEWGVEEIEDFRISINLSALDFKRGDFFDWMVKLLADSDHDPKHLELELTETSLMANSESTRRMLERLRDLGVELSIDDFGTGYSSLQYLKNFPLSRLKIDRPFIRDVAISKSDASIAHSVITMVHGLGMKVVAEGVETEAQIEFLKAENCDEVQGYYISTPLAPDEFRKFLSEHKPA